MRRLIVAALLAAPAAVVGAAPATATPDVDRLLSGTVTGPATHCIRPRQIRGQTIVDQSTIVFERGGGAYWRSDVGPACPALRPDRAIVTREVAIGLCEGDIFQVFDPVSRVAYGSCTFGPFVPYQRPPRR